MAYQFILLRLSLIAVLSLFCACQDAEPPNDSVGPLAVRVEVHEGTEGAIPFEDGNGKVWFGPANHFNLSSVREVKGAMGEPVIAFSIAKDEAASFVELTKECVNHRMAIEVDGVIYCTPHIMSPLPGSGQISNGVSGFNAEEMANLLARLGGSIDG